VGFNLVTISHVPMLGILVQDVDTCLSKSMAAEVYGRVMPAGEVLVSETRVGVRRKHKIMDLPSNPLHTR